MQVVRGRGRGIALTLAGFVASALAVVGGGQTVTPTTVPPTSWFGLLVEHSPNSAYGQLFGALLFASLAALSVLWVAAVRAVSRGALTRRWVWLSGAAWAAPFAVGPPIISKDVHAYAAQGIMAAHGLNAYTSGPAALARLHSVSAGHALAAVDPKWRFSLSPYGPLASFIERSAAQVTGGDPVGTVIALRVAAVACVAALAVLAVTLAGPRRDVVAACVLLNPLVLVHAVSGAHFEAEMAMLLLAGVLAATRRSWILAIVLVCAAGSVKAPAFAALPILIAVHLQQQRDVGVSTGRCVGTAVRDVFLSGASVLVFALLVPDGLGWIRNLSTPTQTSTPSLSTGLVALVKAITPVAWSNEVKSVVGIFMLALAAVLIAWLARTAHTRPLEVSVGAALLALAALTPVFYPWYLLWGVICLLVVARGTCRDALLAACTVATLMGATGTPASVARMLDVLAASAAAVWIWRRRSSETPTVRERVKVSL